MLSIVVYQQKYSNQSHGVCLRLIEQAIANVSKYLQIFVLPAVYNRRNNACKLYIFPNVFLTLKHIYLITRFVVWYRWVFLRVVPYFDEPVGRFKIQTMSKNSQRYYTTKRLIRDECPCGKISRIFNLRGMRDRSMRSGTELAREIQLTDWSTVGNLSNRSSGVQIPRDICTRFGRYLYSTKCGWIIISVNVKIFITRFEGKCKYFSFIKLDSSWKLALSRNKLTNTVFDFMFVLYAGKTSGSPIFF